MSKIPFYKKIAASAVIAGAMTAGALFPVAGVVLGAGYVLTAFSLTLGFSSLPVMIVGGLVGGAIGLFAGRKAFSPFGRFANSCLDKLGFRQLRKEAVPERCMGFFYHAKEFFLDGKALIRGFNSVSVRVKNISKTGAIFTAKP